MMLLWELREGFYIKAYSQSAGGRNANALQFIPLDAKSSDPPPLLFNFTFDKFTADPGQELVAVLSQDDLRTHIHVHLCSSMTGLAHPLAHNPRLTAEFDSNFLRSASHFGIEIVGHLVLILLPEVRGHAFEILIWNWKFGIFLNRISSRRGICDFTFLDQRHLVVLAATSSGREYLDTLALLVFVISDGTSTRHDLPPGQLRVVDAPVSRPILRLEFPRTKEAFKISRNRLLLQSDPTPGRILYAKSAAFVCPHAITLGMTFSFCRVNSSSDEAPYYRVFIDGRFLLDRIRTNAHVETEVLSWSVWGPNATRWFPNVVPPDYWISWMSRSRFIASPPNTPYHFVFDFSSPAIGLVGCRGRGS
ncbi:hypothetical protein RSAG8_06265, partial [Rhizoctonia solani AG-8 WAC10335]